MSEPARPLEPCLRPASCPVPVQLFEDILRVAADSLPVASVSGGEELARVYWSIDGHSSHNPGKGSTRFAPFPGSGASADIMVPTMYFARTLRTALLETVFHAAELPPGGPPTLPSTVTGNDLLGRLHARLAIPKQVRLLDLRNPALAALGIERSAVVSSPALHYRCTQRVAKLIHDAVPGGGDFDGIIWHSRQTELAAMRAAGTGGAGPTSPGGNSKDETLVLFGTRIPGGRVGGWQLAATPDSNGSLFEGEGERLVVSLAVELGVALDLNVDGT